MGRSRIERGLCVFLSVWLCMSVARSLVDLSVFLAFA